MAVGIEWPPPVATVKVAATLSVPDGYGSHNERRIVWRCPDCATGIVNRYAELWDWNTMRLDAEFGSFGRCYDEAHL